VGRVVISFLLCLAPLALHPSRRWQAAGQAGQWGDFILGALSLLVDLAFECSRRFEGDGFSGCEDDRLPGLGVSSPSFLFFEDCEFAEAGDEDVFTVLQRLSDDFKESVDDLPGLGFGVVVFL
jgi:hypothetical protein